MYPQRPLIDADPIAYRAACAVKDDEPVQNALHNAKVQLERIVDIFDRGLEYKAYLTGSGNYRHDLATIQPYKGNRTQPKPQYLEAVREYMVYAWKAVVVDGREADDACGCDQWASRDKSTCIVSIDKDLKTIPGWHFNPVKEEHSYVTLDEANKFFYTQLLTGDRTDNIRGVDGIGPKKAEKFLEGLRSEHDMYRKCLDVYTGKYKDKGLEYLLENAQLLYIQRKGEDDRWQVPL